MIYLYQNPVTLEIKEVVQTMCELHKHFDDNGLEWKRIWTLPCMNIDSVINPLSSQEFINKTKNKSGNVGDLFDLSRELSEKREKIQGKDMVKESYYKKHFKEKRKLHPAQKKELLKKSARENRHFDIEI